MLAQIKSDDEGVWTSLQRSGHISGEPGVSLRGRLERMRNWIEGEHFPEAARITIQNEVDSSIASEIDEVSRSFLGLLTQGLGTCNWNEDSISETIRECAANSGLGNRKAYIALYLVILGRDYGPRISSLMSEMDREFLIGIISSI